MTTVKRIVTGRKARKVFDQIGWEVVPGTDMNEIREAHPEWTEDQCRAEQARAAEIGLKDFLRTITQ